MTRLLDPQTHALYEHTFHGNFMERLLGTLSVRTPQTILRIRPSWRPRVRATDLFESLPGEPEGRYAADFVSPAVEQKLISEIRTLPLQPFQFGLFEGKRRVASFGFRYDYDLRLLQRAEPMPDWLAETVEKVETFGGPSTRIRQVLCTEYDVGVGIGWHRDKPHFERVFGLSLGSASKFRFRRPAGKSWERFTLDAEPRSLYMMSGPSRQIWEHSIPAVEAPRYSITFRTITEEPDLGTSA